MLEVTRIYGLRGFRGDSDGCAHDEERRRRRRRTADLEQAKEKHEREKA
jgi:hypothetical protein